MDVREGLGRKMMNVLQQIDEFTVDPLQFRRALENFATGVTIVTAQKCTR